LGSTVAEGKRLLDKFRPTQGHELDRKTAKQVSKAMIGRRLSQEEAKRLLAKFD
jgi:hypothetical protein